MNGRAPLQKSFVTQRKNSGFYFQLSWLVPGLSVLPYPWNAAWRRWPAEGWTACCTPPSSCHQRQLELLVPAFSWVLGVHWFLDFYSIWELYVHWLVDTKVLSFYWTQLEKWTVIGSINMRAGFSLDIAWILGVYWSEKKTRMLNLYWM